MILLLDNLCGGFVFCNLVKLVIMFGYVGWVGELIVYDVCF